MAGLVQVSKPLTDFDVFMPIFFEAYILHYFFS